MSFNKFTWVDRVSEYPDRRTLTDTTTQESQVVTIARNEGTVTQQGTAFNATNMNGLEERIEEMFPVGISDIKTSEIINLIYPIGSIYISTSSADPQTLFGGTWQQVQNKFLLAAGSSYTAGDTGGSTTHTHTTASHTLTTNEIPSHSHRIDQTIEQKFSRELGNWTTFKSGTSDVFPNEIWTQSAGGSQAHNHGDTGSSSNMPPYLVVYVWKRMA